MNKKIEIKSKKLFNFLIYLNKYKNPFLLFILFFEEKIFDLLVIYKSKYLKIFFFFIFIFIINPFKIFLYKFYHMVNIWKNFKYNQIIINRMIGLILSILVFTNIIIYLKYILGINILGIIYLYLLVVTIFSEYQKKETCENKFLHIFLVLDFSSINLIYRKLNTNIFSFIFESNNMNKKKEISYYVNSKQIAKIEKFKIGYTWYIINNIIFFFNKPSYFLYSDINFLLEHYFYRIDDIVFLKIHN